MSPLHFAKPTRPLPPADGDRSMPGTIRGNAPARYLPPSNLRRLPRLRHLPLPPPRRRIRGTAAMSGASGTRGCAAPNSAGSNPASIRRSRSPSPSISSPPSPSSLERPSFPSSSSLSPRSSSLFPLLEALTAFSAAALSFLLTAAQSKRGQSLLSATSEVSRGEASILRRRRFLPTGGDRLYSYPDLPRGAHGLRTSKYSNNGTGLVENRRGEGERGRTGKDADVEDVDVKADGEVIALPSLILPRIRRQIRRQIRMRRRRQVRRRKLWSGRPRPSLRLRPIPKENLKKQNPISHGETGVK